MTNSACVIVKLPISACVNVENACVNVENRQFFCQTETFMALVGLESMWTSWNIVSSR